MTSSSPPLGKYLASSDKKTRDKAVKHLALFFSSPENNALPESRSPSFWMSDKPRVQQDLAQELAELLLTITSIPSSLSFLKGFWISTVREWNGIDRLRMDKYYMLVRRFVNASFRLLIRAQWNNSALQDYTSILTSEGGPLCPTDIRVPTGLTFHLAEIYLEELEKAVSASDSPLPTPILGLLSPFISLAAHTPTNTTYKHLEESLFRPLLAGLRASGHEYPTVLSNACADAPDTGSPMAPSTLREAMLQKLFAIASAEDTRDSNRRKMYALYKTAVEEDEDNVG
ncbi:nucleolar protein,Nop52-domain-containing protein [Boletus edulis]|nr:nucleolar protein,Nop52-domain-containing protein [Boletus edulis]